MIARARCFLPALRSVTTARRLGMVYCAYTDCGLCCSRQAFTHNHLHTQSPPMLITTPAPNLPPSACCSSRYPWQRSDPASSSLVPSHFGALHEPAPTPATPAPMASCHPDLHLYLKRSVTKQSRHLPLPRGAPVRRAIAAPPPRRSALWTLSRTVCVQHDSSHTIDACCARSEGMSRGPRPGPGLPLAAHKHTHADMSLYPCLSNRQRTH